MLVLGFGHRRLKQKGSWVRSVQFHPNQGDLRTSKGDCN